MKWYQVDEDKKRRERQHRRKVIADWKAEIKAIRDADPDKKMLMREAKQVSLARIEDAARTIEQFEDVLIRWDNMKIVEDWRLAKHEEKYDDDLPDMELSDRGVVIPPPLDHVWWRQSLGGNFDDTIHDCPHELYELTSSRPVFDFTAGLDDSHGEILYYRAIRQWSPQKIAALRGQTDRNIRKVYSHMIGDMRRKMYMRLRPRYEAGEPLTHNQREFCKTYWDQLDGDQKDRLLEKMEKERSRKRKDDKGGKA